VSDSLAAIETLEEKLLSLPQIDVPLWHLFAPGVYVRVVKMPKGSFIIGHQHTTRHLNFVMSGRATVGMGTEVTEMVAPLIFVSEIGVRKVLQIHEEMLWATVHPTEETNLQKLEEQLIIKSQTFKQKELL